MEMEIGRVDSDYETCSLAFDFAEKDDIPHPLYSELKIAVVGLTENFWTCHSCHRLPQGTLLTSVSDDS